MPQQRIASLDGWRAMCVLAVVFHHLVSFSLLGPWLISKGFGFGSYIGNVGVMFFFVISGYVITKGLLDRYELNGEFSFRSFYIRRFFRILPPLWVLFLVTFAYEETVQHAFDFHSLTKAAFFVCNLADCRWNLAHTWSLSYEEQFYVIAPCLLYMLLRKRKFNLYPIIYLALLACTFGSFLLHFTYLGRMLCNFQMLLMGTCLAVYQDSIKVWITKLPQLLYLPMVLFAFYLPGIPPTKTILAVTVMIHPFLIAISLFYPVFKPGWSSRFLSLPFMTYLGRISYGVYLFQQIATGPSPNGSTTYYLYSVPACFLLGAISFHWIEKRMDKLSRSIIGKKPLQEHGIAPSLAS